MVQFCNTFLIISWGFISITSSTQRIEPNEANCNNFYSASVTLSPNNKIGTMSLENYFEMEFDLELTGCTSSSSTSNIIHIGATDSTQDNDHFPHFSISQCAEWQYTYSTNENSDNLNGVTFNDPPVNIPGSHHIYASFTPTAATLSIDNIDRTWNASSRSNFFSEQWSIYISNYGEAASLDAVLSNICIRSWSAGQYTLEPTKMPTKHPTNGEDDGSMSNIVGLLLSSEEIQIVAAVGGSILFLCCICVIICLYKTHKAKALIAKNAELIRIQSITQNRNITGTDDKQRAAAIFAGVSPDPSTKPKRAKNPMTFAKHAQKPNAAPIPAPVPKVGKQRLNSMSVPDQSPDEDDDFVDL